MTAPPALQRLLHEVVDYAGLYPPARLGMSEAVMNYAAYRTGPQAWMLGRFIVPVSRLDEMAEAVAGQRSPPRTTWRISAVAGDDAAADAASIIGFNGDHQSTLRVDALEIPVADPADVERIVRRPRERLSVYVEFPLTRDPGDFLEPIQASGVRAKARTGGITSEAIPATSALARFLECCVDAGVPFKATAGLHHPLRAEYRLTYDDDAPRGTMHGFLNVLAAAALVRCGVRGAELEEVLEERESSAFQFDGELVWRDRRLSDDDVRSARGLAVAFGSCSFTEPVEELAALGLL